MLEQNYGIKIHSMNLLCLHPNNDDYLLIPVPIALLEGITPKTKHSDCNLEEEVETRCMIDTDSDDEPKHKKTTKKTTKIKSNNSGKNKTTSITKPKITNKKRTKCMIDSDSD